MQESTCVDQLQQNVTESHDVHKRTQWTIYCGVSLCNMLLLSNGSTVLLVQMSQAVMLLVKHKSKAVHFLLAMAAH